MDKKRLIGGSFFIILILVSLFFLTNKNAGEKLCPLNPTLITMKMSDSAYAPQSITVKRCTKVTFKNDSTSDRWPASDLHPTHGIYPEFDPQIEVPVGKSWSYVFSKIGNWRYHDHLNPIIRGKITVTP